MVTFETNKVVYLVMRISISCSDERLMLDRIFDNRASAQEYQEMMNEREERERFGGTEYEVYYYIERKRLRF
jgi:hypothetical protein